MKLKTITTAWDDFFFKPASPLPIAVFRIMYGLLMLLQLTFGLFPDRAFWYGTNGIVDTTAALKFFWQQPVFDLLNVTGTGNGGLLIFFAVAFTSALFLTIGLATRYSAWVLFMCIVSLHYHNPWNINGGDCFLRLTAMYLAFSQCGEMLSVDRWLKKKYAPESVIDTAWPWAQRLFQLQIAVVYWQCSVAKLSGQQWMDGSAVWYATRLEDLIHLHVPFLFDSVFLCHLLSWGTLVIEVALWTLIWIKEFRYYVLLAGLALHVGIDLFISLPYFEWVFMASYVTFVEPADIEKFFAGAKAFAGRLQMKIYPPKSLPLPVPGVPEPPETLP